MRKIKIFKSVEDDLTVLEKEINAWVESAGVQIVSVTGNIAPQSSQSQLAGTFAASDVLIIVVYEKAHG